MVAGRAELVNRKLDLYQTIQKLDEDHRDGQTDPEAYQRSRARLELEAAEVLKTLDSLEDETSGAESLRRRRFPLPLAATLCLIAGALLLLLVGALHPRLAGGTVTGDVPGSTVAPTPTAADQLNAAKAAVQQYPDSADAQLALGNAYIRKGDSTSADIAYLTAMRLAPNRPDPITMHAMVMGSEGYGGEALSLLRQVETRFPRYARAWLLDGLVSSANPADANRSIAAWQRYLALQPNSPVAKSVRQWLAAALKARSALNHAQKK